MSSPFSRQQQSPRRSRRTASGSNVRDYQENVGTNNAAAARPPGYYNARARNHALSVDTGTTAARRNLLSPYEGDSDDSDTEEFRTRRKHNKRGSILQSGRQFLGRLGGSRDFDEEESEDFHYPLPSNTTRDEDSDGSDECMILTDDEDDGSEPDEPPKKSRISPSSSDTYGTPRSSLAPNNLAAIQSMFAEKHPWRRQSRRDSTKVYSSHGPRLPTVDSMGDDDFDDEPPSTRTSLRDRISGLSILPSRSEEEEEEDESSSSSEDEASSSQSSVSFISDPEEELNLSALENIPNYFTSHPEAMLPYLDSTSLNISEGDCSLFAYEHSLLLRAVLQLLAERDYVGIEADLDDNTCILKKGPLKKATHSVGRTTWRVKYVEVRPGSFSYFEDSAKKRENFGRKTIPLRTNRATCEVLKRNLIALKIEGGPTRLWMTNSEDECQAWVRAIRDSMIGAGAGDIDSNHSLNVSQYQAALDQFQDLQGKLFVASRDDYLSRVDELLRTNIRIPVQWVSDRANLGRGNRSMKPTSASAQMSRSSVGFWKSLQEEDTVSINGCAVSASSPHATERLIGALSRCILEFDKSYPIDGHVEMTELQALSFARDVMMNVLRSRNKDESRLALEYLCQNPKLGVIIEPLVSPEMNDPISLQVNYATEANENPEKDFSGWVSTRTRFKGTWRNRFLIIADGILNVFEHSSPRPHGLRGQLLLSGAGITAVQDKPKNESHLHILRVVSKNKDAERQLSFADESLLEEWKGALEMAADSSSPPNSDEDPSTLVTPRASMIPAAGGRIIQGASESGVKIINRATDQFVKATDMLRAGMRSTTRSSGPHSRTSSTEFRIGGSKHGDNAETSDSFGLTSSFESELMSKQEPTVQITAESTSMYIIGGSTKEEEAWATVRVKMIHSFLLSGGSQGRLTKGDSLVEMEFRRGVVSAEAFLPSEALSP